ncbi:ciliated left-right organizer metallopeptidase [Narcine bancroftii]|uniref:ciliated left-right organizer metallopeptidase n=1 Tax=Narcine bancroftii TaxID=1343680 RepID=UPI003831031B
MEGGPVGRTGLSQPVLPVAAHMMLQGSIPGGLALLLAMTVGCSARCIHDDVQPLVAGTTTVRYGGERATGRSSGGGSTRTHPIRIATFYTSDPGLALGPKRGPSLNASIREAITRLATLLSVIPVEDNLLLSRDMEMYCKSVWRNTSLPNFNKCGQLNINYRVETCLDVVIPDDHLQGYSVWPARGSNPEVVKERGQGVPGADFILYPKAANTHKCQSEPSVMAYAASCKQDQFGRPIAGSITFCQTHILQTASQQRITLTTIHELLHILGFSKGLFSSWRECSGNSWEQHCAQRSLVTNTDHGTVRIFTPSVITQMQLHFQSKSPRLGGPLENWQHLNTPSSHWESRILQGSIMTTSLGSARHTFIDPITLAAMEDTGWYRVKYAATTPLVWGQGKGENFGFVDTCQTNSSQYFCTGRGVGCHYLHLTKGVCLTDELLDGCRIYKPLVNGSECWKPENSRTAENLSASGEIYAPDSRCFLSSLSLEGSWEEMAIGRCYLHRCRGRQGLEVKVQGSDWIPCLPGDSIQVTGYRGHVSCPLQALCQDGQGDSDLGMPSLTSDPQPTPASPVSGVNTAPVLCLGSEGPSGRLGVRLQVSGEPACAQLQEREMGDVAEQIAMATSVPRIHVGPSSTCGPSLLCLELREFTCTQLSVHNLLHWLQRSLSTAPLVLRFHGHNCSILSIRPDSLLTEIPVIPGTVKAARIGTPLAGLLVVVTLAAGIYRRLRTAQARVHAGQGTWAESQDAAVTEPKSQP